MVLSKFSEVVLNFDSSQSMSFSKNRDASIPIVLLNISVSFRSRDYAQLLSLLRYTTENASFSSAFLEDKEAVFQKVHLEYGLLSRHGRDVETLVSDDAEFLFQVSVC